MRVLVCGGRDFSDREMLFRVLDKLARSVVVDCIIEGYAKGADTLAGEWAVARNIYLRTYPANWRKDGRAAGPIRNVRMLEEGRPDLVLAFPGGRGTEHMKTIARKASVQVIEATAFEQEQKI